MAVELRCPGCRAKLRLKSDPEPGTEVECPKCGTTFPAPEPEAEDEAPRKKKNDDGEGGKKPKKTKTKTAAEPRGPRKRRAKKRETSKAALIGVISAAVLMVLAVTGVLIWFFTRTPKAMEMLYYAPEDAQVATGMNIGHAQKYPEFYQSIKGVVNQAAFKQPADAIAKAAGTDVERLVEQAIHAESLSGGSSIIIRTKAEFDDSALAKLPGAAKQSLDGRTYYVAPNMFAGGQRARVFAPTNRLVVVCPEGMKEPVFRKILSGHADNRDATLGVRMGELGKRVTRGTFWQMAVFDQQFKAPAAPQSQAKENGPDEEAAFQKVVADALGGAKGYGIKASLGSREVRLEMVVWYNDGEKAANFAKKMKESDLGKGDEADPPRWFKSKTQQMGDKKIAAQLLSNIGFGSSGPLFYAKSSVETVELKQSGGNIISKVTGVASGQGGPPGMPGGPGAMPGGMPGAPAGGPMPPRPRRRKHARACR